MDCLYKQVNPFVWFPNKRWFIINSRPPTHKQLLIFSTQARVVPCAIQRVMVRGCLPEISLYWCYYCYYYASASTLSNQRTSNKQKAPQVSKKSKEPVMYQSILRQSILRAPCPPPPPRATPWHLNFSKKIVESPPMWARYIIKCPTVRAQENCQIPLPWAWQLC